MHRCPCPLQTLRGPFAFFAEVIAKPVKASVETRGESETNDRSGNSEITRLGGLFRRRTAFAILAVAILAVAILAVAILAVAILDGQDWVFGTRLFRNSATGTGSGFWEAVILLERLFIRGSENLGIRGSGDGESLKGTSWETLLLGRCSILGSDWDAVSEEMANSILPEESCLHESSRKESLCF